VRVQVLVDNKKSWIVPYASELVMALKERGYNAKLLHQHELVERGDILCLLSCEKVFKNLDLNKCNLVVHESYLPKGKGWSPVTWQVLEGKNEIPITLFEATERIDDGPIYKQLTMKLEGHELLPEIKHLQGKLTQQIILDFFDSYPACKAEEQRGRSTFYSKRKAEDSELDIHKTISEQFNLLRVCDNDRYPAFFIIDGKKYVVRIEKG
jgi:methionyl-tRNA formyltransferase